ncbi:hypothetical protein ACHHYP_16170, partial [Achlya hypogyna]
QTPAPTSSSTPAATTKQTPAPTSSSTPAATTKQTPAPTASQTPAPTQTTKPPACPPRVRKAWEKLTAAEQKTFNAAIEAAMDNGLYQRFMRIHQSMKSNREAHNTCVFLFWHRKFLVGFENMLRSLKPEFACLTLPYVDYAQAYADQTARKCDSIESCTPAATGLGGSRSTSRSRIPVSGSTSYPNLPCVAKSPVNHYCEDPSNRRMICAKCLPRGRWAKTKYSTDFSIESIRDSVFGGNDLASVSSAIEMVPHNVFHGYLDGPMANPLVSPTDPIFYLHHAAIDMLHTIYHHCKVEPLNLSNAKQMSDSRSFASCTTENGDLVRASSSVAMTITEMGQFISVDDPNELTAPFFEDVPKSYYQLTDVRNFGANAYVYELNGLMGEMYSTCGSTKSKSWLESAEVTNTTFDHIVNPVVAPVNLNMLSFRKAVIAQGAAQGLSEAEADKELKKIQIMYHQFCLDDPITDFTPEFKAMWHTTSPPAFVLLQSILDGSNPIRLQNWQAINEKYFGCRGDKH